AAGESAEPWQAPGRIVRPVRTPCVNIGAHHRIVVRLDQLANRETILDGSAVDHDRLARINVTGGRGSSVPCASAPRHSTNVDPALLPSLYPPCGAPRVSRCTLSPSTVEP